MFKGIKKLDGEFQETFVIFRSIGPVLEADGKLKTILCQVVTTFVRLDVQNSFLPQLDNVWALSRQQVLKFQDREHK